MCVCVCVRNSNSNSNRMNERATQDNHDPPRALESVCVNERATSSSRTNEEGGCGGSSSSSSTAAEQNMNKCATRTTQDT